MLYFKEKYKSICRKFSSLFTNPTKKQAQIMMYILGAIFLIGGLSTEAFACSTDDPYYGIIFVTVIVGIILAPIITITAGIIGIICALEKKYVTAFILLLIALDAFAILLGINAYLDRIPFSPLYIIALIGGGLIVNTLKKRNIN